MRSIAFRSFGVRSSSLHRVLIGCCSLLLAWGFASVQPVLADGCFVFHWDKKIDINEPTQKAIIVYDAGREDLLLQVKYEGPLEEFGWLIPVPSVPTVQKGSMQPFYELSQLTQRQFGGYGLSNSRQGFAGGPVQDSVRVIELKTVGAYEVAVLSAQNAGSLGEWLRAHDFSVPEGKSEIVDQYIQKSWFFVAARIQLDHEVAFRLVSASSPKDREAPAKARNTLQKQLASGELHPLLISFDTPRCIFPLKISSVAGKPSEVSVYVLSAEPILEPFILGKAIEKFRRQNVEWEGNRERRDANALQCMRNARSLNLAWRMYSLGSAEKGRPTARDWSVEDLEAIGKESEPNYLPRLPEEDSQFPAQEFLQSFEVKPEKIPQCAHVMPRLKNRNWYLTKQVYTFRPEEMQDLELQEAVPLLKAALPNPEGHVAALQLMRYGEPVVPILIAACQSANPAARANAALAMQGLSDSGFIEPLLAMLKDPHPTVRYNAITATALNWDEQFADALGACFRDPYPQIRQEAELCLSSHEPPTRAPVYIAMLRDSAPTVQACAFHVLSRINPGDIPRADLIRLLSSPQFDVVSQALNLLYGGQSPGFGGTFAFGSPRSTSQPLPPATALTSGEAVALITNRFTMARIIGLKILRQNADAQSVELTLPLLRDTNSLVRNRAFSLLKALSGQAFLQNAPARWDEWWATNKTTFTPR